MKDKKIVIKYGSASVSNEDGIDRQRLRKYARNLASLSETYNVVLVCSGSVAAGRNLWSRRNAAEASVDIRVLAMLGSALAFSAWQEALAVHGILAGQLLVTHREVDDPTEGPSLRAAIEANMSSGVITIINENDALSDTELAKLSYGGDNDGLAAHIAVSLKADALIMLTNVNGLTNKGEVIVSVQATANSWSEAKAYVDSSISKLGRGGMLSKVEAATRASAQGIEAYIANAENSYEKIIAGASGTHFVATAINE